MSDPESPNSDKPVESNPGNRVGLLLYKCSTYAAFFGGFTLVVLVAVNAASIAGRTIIGSPLVGDFELVELGCAIAISSFLPLCFLKKGNVTVDFFSARFPERLIYSLEIFTDFLFVVVATSFSLRMTVGVQDFYKYGEETMLLQIPIWIPFIPVLLAFYLLTACALYSLVSRCPQILRIN
jgi:TRAP-type C4-dicarboxylate transport system permease small subunit